MTDASIHVDFLSPESHGLPGRLGLTVAPGKWRPGLDSASDDLLRDDLLRLRDFHGASVLVTLLEDFEMRMLAIPELLETARELGLRSIWFPIPDVSIPSDLDGTVALVEGIVRAHVARRHGRGPLPGWSGEERDHRGVRPRCARAAAPGGHPHGSQCPSGCSGGSRPGGVRGALRQGTNVARRSPGRDGQRAAHRTNPPCPSPSDDAGKGVTT